MASSPTLLAVPRNPKVGLWLYGMGGLIVMMIVYGGWVRLTRSGLAIVEWNVVTGVVPPLSEASWQEKLASYRDTPEYKKVNHGIALAAFKDLYIREYTHRLLGRITGLAFVIPLIIFLVRGTLPRNRILAYLGIGILFAVQGLVGWLMVKSGLVDNPQVSHYRLVIHLGCALALLAAVLWLAFENSITPTGDNTTTGRNLALGLFVALIVQIGAGGLMAGLKAGYVSATFPEMMGSWVPSGLATLTPAMLNLLENPVMVHFQHRWFALVPLGLAVALSAFLRKTRAASGLRLCSDLCLLLLLAQFGLGIAVVVKHVHPPIASLHQATAAIVFILSLLTVFLSRPTPTLPPPHAEGAK